MELASNQAWVDANRIGETDDVALREERSLAGNKPIHHFAPNTKFSCRYVGVAFLVSYGVTNASAFTFQFPIKHRRSATVAAKNVFAFVAKDKPEIVNPIVAERHPNHRGVFI